MKRIVCVWLPDWPMQRRPAVRRESMRACTVLVETTHGVERVVACSSSAQRLGVTPGTTVAEARALCGDDVDLVPHEPAADEAALEELARACRVVSPLVGLDGNDGLAIDVTGCRRLFGDERALLRTLQRVLRKRRLRARLAVADTRGAAHALCRFGEHTTIVVPPGEHRAALQRLPVESLRFESVVVTALRELGVTTVARLERLPRSSLPARFGEAITRRLDQAFGNLAEPVVPVRPVERLRAGREFESPLHGGSQVERVLRLLLARLLDDLRSRREGVLRLDVRLDSEDGSPVAFTVDCARSLDSSDRLERLLALRLERTPIEHPVNRVLLEVTESAPIGWRRTTLFDDDTQHARALDDLVERLSQRLGADAVLRSRPVADAQPELAHRFIPVLQTAQGEVEDEPCARPGPHARPFSLLPHPEPIEVFAGASDDVPTTIRRNGRPQTVHRAWGPERIATGWWRLDTVRRDYFRVETTTGHRYWLFRRLDDNCWFLHGCFD